MSKKTAPPSRTAEQFVIRFPEGMRSHIAESAERNHRSMNNEIIFRLERTFRWDEVDHPNPQELHAEIQSTMKRLDDLMREFRMLQVDPGK